MLFLVASLAFFAFLPLPRPIDVGLDPSWRYALSHFSDQNTFFDSPIVFTYGRWGYLIRGAATEGTFISIFIFRFIVYLIFFALCIVRALSLGSKWAKGSFLLTAILPLAFADKMPMFQTETQVIMAAIILITWDLEWNNRGKIALFSFAGLTCGLLLHTKISLGLYLAPSLFLLTLGSLLAAEPGGLSFGKRAINFLLLLLFSVAGAIVGFGIGLIGSYGFDTDMYSQISSGYSSAMSRAGPIEHLMVGLFLLVAIIVLLILVAKKDQSLLGPCLAIAFISLFTFKHAYVRQGHYLRFLLLAPFVLAAVSSMFSFKQKANFAGNCVNFLAALSAVLGFNYGIQKIGVKSFNNFHIRALANAIPSLIGAKVRAYSNPYQLKHELHQESSSNLLPLRLPASTLAKIGNDSVDIIPSEASLVAANNLNWQPRPVFQSYKAYTSDLDSLNANSVSSSPPEWILLHWGSIDGRHQILDEPSTFLEMLCNYRLYDVTQTDRINPVILLEHHAANLCRSGEWSSPRAVTWGQKILIDSELPTIASVDIRYSALGKMMKSAFRVPPVWLDVENIESGKKNTYRIIPEVLANGLLLAPLPDEPDQLVKLFEGSLSAAPVHFALRVESPWLYQDNPLIRLKSFSRERMTRLAQSDSNNE